MCDLIDLNSPDRKGLLSSRLASPLIPAPTDTECSNNNTRSVIIRKRESLENNPFDMALHKTTEYIQNKNDPFEVTLEKAMKLKCKRNSSLRACSSALTGNDVLEGEPLRDKLKLNKTLDETLFRSELNQNNADTNKISNNNIVEDTNNFNTQSNVTKPGNIIPAIIVQDFDLSILNQSVMNDTLFETDKESDKDQAKDALQNQMFENTEKDRMLIEQMAVSTVVSKVPLKRSLSQGEGTTEKKSKYFNQTSLIETLQIGFNNTSTVSSQNSIDILNKGFLKSFSSGSSVFSSLSNISSIPALNSVSSTISSSLMQSNGTINRSFIESCSSGKSEFGKSSENIDLNREMKLLLPRTRKSIASVGNTSARSSMSDLAECFNKLNVKAFDIQIPKSPNDNEDKLTSSPLNDVKEYVTVMEKSDTCDVNNKLIDVDIFTLENNGSKEICSSSTSDTSSDSVFIDGSTVNKSILQEAKLLARTFEELALKTSSGSSMDDLISSNPLWTSELLPAFDDEDENLIELPVSPDEGRAKSKNVKVVKDNDSCMDKGEGLNNKVQDKVKELEMELVEPMSTGKRLSAVTLLLDLKKLIKTDKNVEANKLLENLEKALGINCQDNTELLATCLNAPNHLDESPKKSDDNVEVIKNVLENSMEHSHENNLSSDSPKSVNFYDSCKHVNSPKYVKNLNNESKYETFETANKSEEMKKEKEEKLNTKNLCTESFTCNEESNNLQNGRVVIELLTNIGKLLSKQTEENPTLDILTNLGNVLNFASNNSNIGRDTNSNPANIKNEQTPKNSKIKCESKKHPSILSKSVNRLSLHSESKKQPSKNLNRRTISASQTLPHKNESISLISANKSISQVKEVTKRFSSDPTFVSPALHKKIMITNHQNVLHKGVQAKPSETLDLSQEKPGRINTVKNKLKKKLGAEVMNKKGPMKAILPIGSMQKKESFIKKIPTAIDTVTPPKSHKIISSTPNSTNGELVFKKSRSSKPVASSTPDSQNSKPRKVQSQLVTSPKKRNFSCDISPVTICIKVNNNGLPKSPRRHSKLPSPKKMTPKRQSNESSIPRSQTPPISKRLNSSFDLSRQCERINQSPQRSSFKTSGSQKYSPVALRTNENVPRSPLRDNNKFTHKVKPTNLISKLRRHSIGANIMEKENDHI